MKRATIYSRVSTDDQAKNGLSLPAQFEMCKSAIEKVGYKLTETIRDDGYSGGNLNRPGIKRLMELCRNKEIDSVFMIHSDRMARNAQDHLKMRALFEEYGVKVVYVMQPNLSNDDAYSKTMDTIMASFNELQRLVISEKTLDTLREKAKEGWSPTRAVPGYKNVPNPNFGKGEISKNIIIPDPEVAPYVKEAHELYATGNYNVRQLSLTMFEKGWKTKSGKPIPINTLNHALKNMTYVGELKWREIHHKKAKHEPIIDRELKEKVLLVMSGHNHFACRKRKHQWLLSGLAYCQICTFRMTGEYHRKNGNRQEKSYYHCRNRKNKCGKFSYADSLEKNVQNQLKNLKFSNGFIQTIVEEARKMLDERVANTEKEKRVLYNQKMATESKRNALEQKLLDNVITDDSFTRMSKKINDELSEIERKLAKLNIVRQETSEQLQLILRFARNIYGAYTKTSFDLKRQYLGLFYAKFLIQEGEIKEIIYSDLFKELTEANQLFVENSQKSSISSTVSPVLLSPTWGDTWELILTESVQVSYFFTFAKLRFKNLGEPFQLPDEDKAVCLLITHSALLNG